MSKSSAEVSATRHTPGDVNHKFLGAAGYNFCPECGVPVRGQAQTIHAELLEALKACVLVLTEPGVMDVDIWKAEKRKAEHLAYAALAKAEGRSQ